jgi:hypothetical protein
MSAAPYLYLPHWDFHFLLWGEIYIYLREYILFTLRYPLRLEQCYIEFIYISCVHAVYVPPSRKKLQFSPEVCNPLRLHKRAPL